MEWVARAMSLENVRMLNDFWNKMLGFYYSVSILYKYAKPLQF